MLYQYFLRTRRFKLDLLDHCDQLLPRLSMRTAILSGIDGGQLPSLAGGKDVDCLPQLDGGFIQGIRRSGPIAALPKIGPEPMVHLFQARSFEYQVLKI
jgi:hypothetical protein